MLNSGVPLAVHSAKSASLILPWLAAPVKVWLQLDPTLETS